MVEGTDPAVGDPIAAWAASGAMALTGHAGGPPLSPAAAVVPALAALAGTYTRLASTCRSSEAAAGLDVDLGLDLGLDVDLGQLLSGRAALRGLGRRGQVSANGSCRLLPTADGWAAVNLARPADVEAVGALVERAVEGDAGHAGAAGAALARGLARMPGADLVDRATLLGLPAAVVPPSAPLPPPGGPGFVLRRLGAARDPDGVSRRRTVVDLSAMWAGPLCARLLGLAGLRVVKVESRGRPDGARAGDARFFDWLHGGHESVAIDLASSGGRAALARLVAAADVVVEASRPRALAQLGIDAEGVVASRPGVTWVSITGYGREGAAGRRVAFGDDAAAAAGLVAHDDRGRPVFCGDAIADPITGLTAAVGALTSIVAGGGHLVDVPMAGAVAAVLAVPAPPAAAQRAPDGGWQVATPTGLHPVVAPRPLPVAPVAARPLGADTAPILHALGTGTPT